MAILFGRNFGKSDLLKRVGSLEQIASIQRLTYMEGPGRGMQVFDIRNADLHFTVLIDRCLDIGALSYKGIPLNFLSKSGTIGPSWHPTGSLAGKSIMGGMLFTCGLSQVGPMEVDQAGVERPIHGLIRSTPANQTSAWGEWIKNEYQMSIRGEVRESGLFESNLVLRRKIQTTLGQSEIIIQDEIENEGYHAAPLMILYHCNVGYPLLDEKSKLIIKPDVTIPRDEAAKAGIDHWSEFDKPVDSFKEQVFYHQFIRPELESVQVELINSDLRIGLRIEYDHKELPYLIQWKSLAPGDYVMGIEPANCHPEGQDAEKRNGTLRYIQPGEIVKTSLKISIFEL